MSLEHKNWRNFVNPHDDIKKDRVSEALFAVNLSRAISMEGPDEYRDPKLFFNRTYLTNTLKYLIVDVVKILEGNADINSVLHLQTNFGGGKTHAELALYHLFNAFEEIKKIQNIQDFLSENNITNVPNTAIAALPCTDLDPGGRKTEDGIYINTLWGEMAYRLGGQELFELIKDSDTRRISPGVEKLRNLFHCAGPCLLLVDELLHYIDKAAAFPIGDSNLGSQTIGFLRELTEAVDQTTKCALVVSLTASSVEEITVFSQEEAESTLSKLEDILRRVEDTRTPIEKEEIYEIVKIRLFEDIEKEMAYKVADEYNIFYNSQLWKDTIPPSSRTPDYKETIARSYPFHPSIINVLYERWGSRPTFQLTRGTLRFLSHLLAYLWKLEPEGHSYGMLIHLSDIDLSDDDVRGEAIRVAGSEWESVIGTDISAWKGHQAISQRLDTERGRLYQNFRLIQGLATSVFMFTQGGIQKKATSLSEIRLAVGQPDIPSPDLNQAFEDCQKKLYYYYEEDGGYIFKTEPNPNKVLADERINVTTDDARLQTERIINEVLGESEFAHEIYFRFHDSQIKETGDIPDDAHLHLVILPPNLTISNGKAMGKTAEIVEKISQTYGKKNRMNRNMIIFLSPDSNNIAKAIDWAMDWIAGLRVQGDSALMARFTETQQELITQKITTATNDTKDFVRKAYNTFLLPSSPGKFDSYEMAYVPPNKKVLKQADQELIARGKIHSEFNPSLFEDRWETLWQRTSTVITTEKILEKFTRNVEAPILTGIKVLQNSIKKGVERELFGYGILTDNKEDVLSRVAYDRIYFGQFDALDLINIEISTRTVLIRKEQLDSIFPHITADEILLLLKKPKQTVDSVFRIARENLSIENRVDKTSFFNAILYGVKNGYFGYSEGLNAPIHHGIVANISFEDINFAGYIIRDDVPLPITSDELSGLIPPDGRISIKDLYDHATKEYGEERTSKKDFIQTIKKVVSEGKFGYAETEKDSLQTLVDEINISGYVGLPETLPPDTRQIILKGNVSPYDLANVIKTVNSLSKLGETTIELNIALQINGDIKDHSVNMAIKELEQRVPTLKIEDRKKEN